MPDLGMSWQDLHLSRSDRCSRILLAVLFSLATVGRVARAEAGSSEKVASTFKALAVLR
jgi:hypothetical protein